MASEEGYGDVAKRVYMLAKEEDWPKDKLFKYLQEPQKAQELIDKKKHLNTSKSLRNYAVVDRMLEDQKKREVKREKLEILKKQMEEEDVFKRKKSATKSRTQDQFLEDQDKFQKVKEMRSVEKHHEEVLAIQ
mmetsp:Transcript_20689/g.19708  ORF Transcript_20689/g.19708 Transcript_20689/m.19708 type:complete len:133 (-) Transcript_20689:669-1067(-)